MRLLSVFLTAMTVTFGLLGVAAFDGPAGAQEESTLQTFEPRESTGQEASPAASPSPTPAPEESTRDDQASTECPGAEVVGTVGPTDEDLLLGPFRITGETFRLTYETTEADESGVPFFDVTVLDEAGNEVGGLVIREEGVEQEVVRATPGDYTIEARSEDLQYEITVEDCTGGDDPPPTEPPANGNDGDDPGDDQEPVPRDPIPDREYEVGPPEDDVIDDTVSDKPLPDTGGVPLLGLAAFGLVCVFAAFALLRPAMRR